MGRTRRNSVISISSEASQEWQDPVQRHVDGVEQGQENKHALMFRSPNEPPQRRINHVWNYFTTDYPGGAETTLPPKLFKGVKTTEQLEGHGPLSTYALSYKEAAEACRKHIEGIVERCKLTNTKFIDHDFNIFENEEDCLSSLRHNESPRVKAPSNASSSANGLKSAKNNKKKDSLADAPGPHQEAEESPKSVHRADWIFGDDMTFAKDGKYLPSDIAQGQTQDCWFLSAISSICAKRSDLIDRICIHDVPGSEEYGVYGFLFLRDGRWIWTVIDDYLFLNSLNWICDEEGPLDPDFAKARKYRQAYQSGSKALFFSRCVDQDSIWLPLLEKAYAKVHGDYEALKWGGAGEAMEDLTGGSNQQIFMKDVASRKVLWEQLKQTGRKYVFAASTASAPFGPARSHGLNPGHVYAILDVVEKKGESGTADEQTTFKLVKLRNPTGCRDSWRSQGSWDGDFGNGSDRWNAYWLSQLNHSFKNDGEFWMLFDDLLETFEYLDRTRLFQGKWHEDRSSTVADAPLVGGYSERRFKLTLEKKATVVMNLSQLDTRYFRGFEGLYDYHVNFMLKRAGEGEKDVLYSTNNIREYDPPHRSASAELSLPAGTYEIWPKLNAGRLEKRWRGPKRYEPSWTVESVLDHYLRLPERTDKLIQTCMNREAALKIVLSKPAKDTLRKDDSGLEALIDGLDLDNVPDSVKRTDEKSHADGQSQEILVEDAAESSESTPKVTPGSSESEPPAARSTSSGQQRFERGGSGSPVPMRSQSRSRSRSRSPPHLWQSTSNVRGGARPDSRPGDQRRSRSPSWDARRHTPRPRELSLFPMSPGQPRRPSRSRSRSRSRPARSRPPPPGFFDGPPPGAVAVPFDGPFEIPPPPMAEPAPKAPVHDIWNAVCVIGLTVHTEGSECSVEVVEPEMRKEKKLKKGKVSRGFY